MQPAPVFKPTAAQRRLLRHVQSNPAYQTVHEICAAAHVDPSSYHRWCRDDAFRAWFLREWANALVFEGWHMLNLARAHMVRSSVHFRALFGLIFDPKGQAALQAWQSGDTAKVVGIPPLNQSLTPKNATFSDPVEVPRLNPSRVARHLDQTLALTAVPPPQEAS